MLTDGWTDGQSDAGELPGCAWWELQAHSSCPRRFVVPGNGAEERCGLAFYFFSLFPLHLAESLARDGLCVSTSPPAPCPSPFPPTPPFLFFMTPMARRICAPGRWHTKLSSVCILAVLPFACPAPAFLSLHEEPGERGGCQRGAVLPGWRQEDGAATGLKTGP